MSGKWMVEYVVDAQGDSGMIARIAIVDLQKLQIQAGDRVDILSGGSHLFDNQRKAILL